MTTYKYYYCDHCYCRNSAANKSRQQKRQQEKAAAAEASKRPRRGGRAAAKAAFHRNVARRAAQGRSRRSGSGESDDENTAESEQDWHAAVAQTMIDDGSRADRAWKDNIPALQKCNCRGRCSTKRCPCFRNGTPCTTQCHGGRGGNPQCANSFGSAK